jgi:hypothetical protein
MLNQVHVMNLELRHVIRDALNSFCRLRKLLRLFCFVTHVLTEPFLVRYILIISLYIIKLHYASCSGFLTSPL